MKDNKLSLNKAIFSSRDPKEIIAYGKDCTYRLYDLQLYVKSLSLYLSISSDIKTVAICVEDAFLFTVAFASSLYAKKIPVLLGTSDPNTVDDIKNKCDLVITDNDSTSDEIQVFDIRVLLTANPVKELSDIPSVNKDAALTPVLDDFSKIIFYTSGSTGKAKRIEKSLDNMQQEALRVQLKSPELDSLENKLLLATVPPFHLYGLTFRIFMPLLRHIPFYTQLTHYTEELCAKTENIILVSSPAFLKRIDKNLVCPNISFTLSAGSPLKDDVAKDFFAWSNCPVTEIYGSTETNVIGFRKAKGEAELFTTFDDVYLKKENSGIVLYSPMIDKKFKLDDNLEFEDERFKVIGRVDKIIKIEEKRVSLTQIENLVKQFCEVTDVVALPIDKRNRTFIGLVIAVNNGTTTYSDTEKRHQFVTSIKNTLKKHIPYVAMPRYVRIVNTISTNEMGKKITAALRELFND